MQVSCGLPNPHGLLLGPYRSKYRRLSGRPRIQGRPLNGFRPHFPIKAPTRQMLYPLSYRGTFQYPRMLARQKPMSTKMPRACPVEFQARRYTRSTPEFQMPRACPVDLHVSSYIAANVKPPRHKAVASKQLCLKSKKSLLDRVSTETR